MTRILLLFLVAVFCQAGCSQQDSSLSLSSVDDQTRLMELDRIFMRGDYGQVITEAQQYVAQHPKSFKGWSVLAWAYLKTDEVEKAKECIDKSLAINPRWDNAYVAQGVLYRKQGDLDAAVNAYLKAIELVPDNAEAFGSLLVIELMRGNDQKAVEYGEKAWALRKDYPTIAANLSVAYHYAGNYEKRDEFYKHAERLGYLNLRTIKDIFDGKVSLR